MANLSRIPIRYFQQTDLYGFVVDNRPLKDLAQQIVAVNEDILSINNTLNVASGSKESLNDRLNVSLNDDGSLKTAAIPDHPIKGHTDGDGFVRMTAEERVKLSNISDGASNFSMSTNSTDLVKDGVLNLEDSASVKIFRNGTNIKLYSIVPLSYYHKHYGPIEPLVKCRKEGSEFIADENADPAYYKNAITSYRIDPNSSDYPSYFYTSDGVPVGENDGTPRPFRVGSLTASINGNGISTKYSASDASVGRWRISEDEEYLPRYVSGDDFDTFYVNWVKEFEEETESLGPAMAPMWWYQTYTSSITLEIRSISPKSVEGFKLSFTPSSREQDWETPSNWLSKFSRLRTPSAVISDDGSMIAWNNETDPQKGQGGWLIIREDNGSSYDYYIVWLSSASPNYPIGAFYQRDV